MNTLLPKESNKHPYKKSRKGVYDDKLECMSKINTNDSHRSKKNGSDKQHIEIYGLDKCRYFVQLINFVLEGFTLYNCF